jgi:hypothetical protein
MTYGVDAAGAQGVQAARVNPVLDLSATEADIQKLATGDHPVLPIRQGRDLPLLRSWIASPRQYTYRGH